MCGRRPAGEEIWEVGLKITQDSTLFAQLLVASVLSASPVTAQDSQGSSGQAAGSKSPPTVCMSREKTGPASGRTEASSRPTNIVVPDQVSSGLIRKGFRPVKCSDAKLDTDQAKRAWRDEICTKAAYGNQAVQNQYARLYGARPAALCAAAQRVAGKVDRDELLSRQAQ